MESEGTPSGPGRGNGTGAAHRRVAEGFPLLRDPPVVRHGAGSPAPAVTFPRLIRVLRLIRGTQESPQSTARHQSTATLGDVKLVRHTRGCTPAPDAGLSRALLPLPREPAVHDELILPGPCDFWGMWDARVGARASSGGRCGQTGPASGVRWWGGERGQMVGRRPGVIGRPVWSDWAVSGVRWGVSGVRWGVSGVRWGVSGVRWGVSGVRWGVSGVRWGVSGVRLGWRGRVWSSGGR